MSHEILANTACHSSLLRDLNLLHAVMENTPDACYVKDLAGRYQYCNTGCQRLWARSVQEIIGRDDAELVGLEAAANIQTQDRRIVATGVAETEEQVVVAPDVTRVFQITKSPYRDSQGVIQGIVGIARELTAPLQAEETIRHIAAGNTATGKEYFRELVMHLCKACRVEFCFIGVLDTDANHRVNTLSACQRSKLIDNFSYDLENTPCQNVVGKVFCFYPSGVQQSFLRDTLLVQMGIDSYMGIPLFANSGTPLGLIVLLNDRPFPLPEQSKTILEIVAARAGAELERVLMEEQLRASEIRFRELVDAIPQIVWVAGPDGAMLHLNAKSSEYTGIVADQLTGWSWDQVIHPDDLGPTMEKWTACIRDGISTDIALRIRRHDSEYRWHIGRQMPVRDASGAISLWYGTCTDIEDLKQAENSLRVSEERFRLLYEGAADAIIWADAETGLIIQCNHAAEVLLQRERREVIGQHQSFLHPPEETTRYKEAFHKHAILNSNTTVEFEILRKDGQRVDVAISPSVTTINGQRVIQGLFRDISVRKRTEQSLQMMRFSIDHAGDSVFWVNRQGAILYANEAACKGRSYSQDEMLRMTVFDLDVEPEYQPDLWGVHFDDLKKRKTITLETRHRTKDGRIIPVEVNANYVSIDNQELNLAFVRDVTERKRAEAERRRVEQDLRTSEERFSKLFYASPFSILVATYPDGKIVEVNEAFLRLFDFQRNEVIGRTTGDLNIWVDPEARVSMVDRLRRNGSSRDMEIAFRAKSGALLTLMMSVEIIDLQGQPHSLAMSIDVTDHKQIEQQLRQSQKMEAIGQLAGGVAHDFNNLLTVINGYCDMLLAKQSEQNRWAASVQEIREAGRRAAELTEQLLAFSRRSYTQRKVVQLDEVVAGAEKLLRRLIGEQIILTVQPGTKHKSIKADVNQLEQVLMNLAVNARDAMPNGGQLTITTKSIVSSDSSLLPSHDGQREFVQLDVADTGFGMTDEIQSKVFEPFFTTKATGKGSGLGLAVVHGIMQQNCGSIRIKSVPGQGTTFSMVFPVVDDAPALESETTDPIATGGSETILVVEDEPGVRKFVRTVLEIQGYNVLMATNGHEAVALARHSREPIHLLLTDVVMPGIDGRVVADSLRTDNPKLRVIFISGYNELEHFKKNTMTTMEAFLRKPFTPQELLSKVREHIDAGRAK